MQKTPTILRQITSHIGTRVCIASAVFCPLNGFSATVQEVSATIRQQVLAKPADAPAILEKSLRELPEGERLRYASAAFAAALEGAEKNSDRVLRLFEKAVAAAPKAAVGLLEVAHRAAPDRILELTEIAIRQVTALGLEELVPAIVAKAVALAPGQRVALTRLALGMVPATLGERILDALAAALTGPGAAGRGAGLGGTINPANIGGSVVSPEQ